MAPIRVGIIGLSANSAGAAWAKLTHLPYLRASPKYEITGVLNSSFESSQAAIKAFDLLSAKPFGIVESLAADPNIDLIVVCVEVAKHAHFVRPALQQSKNVFCEWPLARGYQEAQELASLAAQKNVQTYVALESPLSPAPKKIRELIANGSIGKILSTNVLGSLGPPLKVWSSRVPHALDVHSGQSPLHTRASHFLAAFCSAVGKFETSHPLLATHQKDIKAYDTPLSVLGDLLARNPDAPYQTIKRTAPDEILVQGSLGNGAIASIHLRFGSIDSQGNNLRWVIIGTEGLIEVTQQAGQFLRDLSVQIKLVKDGKVEPVTLDWSVEGDSSVFGDNVGLTNSARHYAAIAKGDKDATVDFEEACRWHRMVDDIVERGLTV